MRADVGWIAKHGDSALVPSLQKSRSAMSSATAPAQAQCPDRRQRSRRDSSYDPESLAPKFHLSFDRLPVEPIAWLDAQTAANPSGMVTMFSG